MTTLENQPANIDIPSQNLQPKQNAAKAGGSATGAQQFNRAAAVAKRHVADWVAAGERQLRVYPRTGAVICFAAGYVAGRIMHWL